MMQELVLSYVLGMMSLSVYLMDTGEEFEGDSPDQDKVKVASLTQQKSSPDHPSELIQSVLTSLQSKGREGSSHLGLPEADN
jgi:hypothetical protein